MLFAACGCASWLAWAQETPPAKVVLVPQRTFYPRPAQFAQLTGTCSMEVAPAEAVIVGGIAVDALKPTEAAAQVDRQLESIRKYVEEQHGHLELLERARTVLNPPPNGAQLREPPFQEVQRLEAKFAADAPIDAILDRLIELGLDRFGENVMNINGSRRETVVRFRIADWDARMHDLQDRCLADAWKKWCATDAAKDVCHSDKPPAEIQMQYFNVRSAETSLYPEGGARRLEINIAPHQRTADPPDLSGNITLHLNGSATWNYSYNGEEKP
ncbi:MAG: SIMPL domain-containing protein [Candidatus Acidiferrales bacterium]